MRPATKDGLVKIDFTPKLKVPDFVRSLSGEDAEEREKGGKRWGTKKRALSGGQATGGLGSLDPNEFLTVELVKRDDGAGAPASKSQFAVSIKSWTEDGMDLGLEFDNPLEISQGTYTDMLSIKVKTPDFFVSEAGLMLEAGGVENSEGLITP